MPGSLLSQVSALACPDAFVWARLRDAVLSIADPTAMDVYARVERWALDEVPLPGPLVSEIVQSLYRENRFCRGTLTIRDRSLGPSSVRVPILAIVNTADEIAPLNSVKHFLDEMPKRRRGSSNILVKWASDFNILAARGASGTCSHLACNFLLAEVDIESQLKALCEISVMVATVSDNNLLSD